MSKKKPPTVVMEQFFKPSPTKKGYPQTVDSNCDACGAHVIPSSQVKHVEWHQKLTKLFEGKRDKL